MKLIEQIARERESGTKTERRIAGYILERPLEFAVASVGSVAEELGISKTSLLRFAKGHGFENYPEFRRHLQEEVIASASPAERFSSLMENRRISGIAELASLEMDNIRLCLEHLDGQMMDRVVERMTTARMVYTAGRGMSAFAAEIMGNRMRALGFSFEYLPTEREELKERLIYAQQGDLLILFDYPDYAPCLQEGAAYAKTKGVEVVLITDYAACPLVKYADEVFYCAAQTDLFKNSLVAPVFLINALMSQAIYRDEEKMLTFLRRREEVRRSFCDELERSETP